MTADASECRGEADCAEPVAGFIDGLAVCETHLAREFERRVAAGEEVAVGEPGALVALQPGLISAEEAEGLRQLLAERGNRIKVYTEIAELHETDDRKVYQPVRPGLIVLYHDPRGPLVPAIVVATAESRAGNSEGALAWFPDFEGCKDADECVHLAVFNPEPQQPLRFVPRVPKGDGPGEWRWP